MARRPRVLVTILIVLLQIGFLPVQAGAGQMTTCGETVGDTRCCCCEPEVMGEAMCCAPAQEPVQAGCPCNLESPTDDRVQIPPPTNGSPTVPAMDVTTALPSGAVPAPVDASLPERVEAQRARARAGPPLFRLFAVDRR